MDYITKTITVGFTVFVEGAEIGTEDGEITADIDFQIVNDNVEVVGVDINKDKVAAEFKWMLEHYGEQMLMENESGIREEIHEIAEAYEVNHQVDMDQERKTLGDSDC